jgi:PAT family beta-lactamase induction signal transducer AmpG
MLPLGFSSGLPFLLVFSTLSTWLREAGISLTAIGLMSWVGLAYSLKFLWAPLVDRYDAPFLTKLLGRRRGWMLLAQLGIIASLVSMALTGPQAGLPFTIISAVLIAFFSATQDVVIDGWRIDAAPTERQGMMAASAQLGYRLGLICAGAGALYIAEFASWPAAYLSMAALVGVGVIGTFLAPRIDEIQARQKLPFSQAIIEPLADLFQRKRMMLVPILALVACYRLPDFMAGIMANPLYIDLGFTKADIANVSKLYGVWIGIIGAFSGGIALTRIGLWWTLLIGAAIAAGSNLMFSWLAAGNATLTGLTLTISIDNFAQGFAGAALIAYMSSLTSPGFTATQYALLSSLYALPGKLMGGASGAVVDAYGYPLLFTGTAAIGIPLVILCLLVRRDTVEAVKEKEAEATASPVSVGSRA